MPLVSLSRQYQETRRLHRGRNLIFDWLMSSVTTTADEGSDGFDSPDGLSYADCFSDSECYYYTPLLRALRPDSQMPKDYETAACQLLHRRNLTGHVTGLSCNLEAGILRINLRSSLQSPSHARVFQGGELLQMPGAPYRQTNRALCLPKQVYHKTKFKEMVNILQDGFMTPFQVTLMAVKSMTRTQVPISVVNGIHKFLRGNCKPSLHDHARVLLEKGIVVQDNYPSFDGYTAFGRVIPTPPCTRLHLT